MAITMRSVGVALIGTLLASWGYSAPPASAPSMAASAQDGVAPTGKDSRERVVNRLANAWMLKALTPANNAGKDDLVARILARQEVPASLMAAWYVTGSRGSRDYTLEFLKNESAVLNAQRDGKVAMSEQSSLDDALREAALNDAIFSARLDVRQQLSKHILATASAPAAISADLGKVLVVAEISWDGAMTPELAEAFVKTEAAFSKQMTDDLQRSLHAAEQTYLGGVTDAVADAIAATAAVLEQSTTEQLRQSRQRVTEALRQVLSRDPSLMESFNAGAALEAKYQNDELLNARASIASKLLNAANTTPKEQRAPAQE